MAKLTVQQQRLIDGITGMSTGYVCDFSNNEFYSFFRDELGAHIETERFERHGSSKGKRLRAFIEDSSDFELVAFLNALWPYSEEWLATSEKKNETQIAELRTKLIALIVELGGQSILPEAASTIAESSSGSANSMNNRPSEFQLQTLSDKFRAIHSSQPQRRGYEFEAFLKEFFSTWNVDARGGFSLAGEQIDGSISIGSDTYLIEAKWQKDPIRAADLHSFQGKLDERSVWTLGIFISYSGYSPECFQAFTPRKVVLFDGRDIDQILSRGLSPVDVIARKRRSNSETREAFTPVSILYASD